VAPFDAPVDRLLRTPHLRVPPCGHRGGRDIRRKERTTSKIWLRPQADSGFMEEREGAGTEPGAAPSAQDVTAEPIKSAVPPPSDMGVNVEADADEAAERRAVDAIDAA
jgi:hypothetical protein